MTNQQPTPSSNPEISGIIENPDISGIRHLFINDPGRSMPEMDASKEETEIYDPILRTYYTDWNMSGEAKQKQLKK